MSDVTNDTATPDSNNENPLLSPSPLECELPPFADIAPADYKQAYDALNFKQEMVVSTILHNGDAPTFANTIEPLEKLQIEMERAFGPFFTLLGSDTTPEMQKLEEELAPKLAELSNLLELNGPLLERIDAVGQVQKNLTAEQKHIIERLQKKMRLAGADLDGEAATKVMKINEELAELATEFDKNLLADTTDLAVHVTDKQELDGLNSGEIEAAAAAAKARGLDGYLITLTYPTGHEYLAKLTNRGLRERLMKASLARASRGNANDNRAVLLKELKLRAQRAKLLGYPNHAAWSTAGGTAKTTDAVLKMLEPIARKAAENARKEQQDLAAAAKADGIDKLESWDWDYYTEKVRKEKHDIDVDALKPYFEADNVLHKGVFAAANRLYGVSFHPRADLVGWNTDTQVFEIRNENGEKMGLFLIDIYARDSKRGGAWMHELVMQNHMNEQLPVVCNNLNVAKPATGEPTLLTLDQVETLFHEFGHALHGMLSNVTYPSVSGTAVERDFVEFPSQVNEMWMLWPDIVSNYAVHYKTGEKLPQEVLDRLENAETFNQGFLTSEYLSAALIDFEWHLLAEDEVPTEVDEVLEFDNKVRAKYGLDNAAVESRYHSPYFQHIFSGGYSAGYYGYIWSEVLDADAVEWFKKHGGATRENGQHFADTLLSVGGSKDAMVAYEDFLGRPASPEPLMKRRGLN